MREQQRFWSKEHPVPGPGTAVGYSEAPFTRLLGQEPDVVADQLNERKGN